MPNNRDRNSIQAHTKELEYRLSDDGTHYSAAGTGICNAAELEIASECNHLPVMHIASRAFANCRTLTSIVIQNGIISIGESAFSGCFALKSITLPNSVQAIEEGAFAGCRSLKGVYISHGVQRIGDSAFDGCNALAGITLSDSVKSIGNGAFDGCRKLNKIHFQGTKAEWKAIEKEPGWNNWTGDFTVICTDGTLDKDGNEIE